MNIIKDLPNIEINNNILYSNEVFQFGLNHFAWFHNFNVDIKESYVSDVEMNPNEKYYFIHFISFFSIENLTRLYSTNNNFSKQIKKLLKYKNFRIIFLDVHESHEHYQVDNFFECFDEKEKILFINNDYNLKNKKIKTIKSNFLVKNSIKNFIENDLFKKSWNDEKRNKMFLCKNKSGKAHRYFTLCLLDNYELLEKTNYSFLTYPDTKNEKIDKSVFLNFDKSEIKIQELVKNSKYTDFEHDFDFNLLEKSNYNFAGELISDDYKNSYVNITTESVYFGERIHVTEKSIKPFFLSQLPIFVSSYHHVKHLKENLNLDLFDDFINHNYDNEKDDTHRLKMVIEECSRLSKMENEIILFFKNNKERFEKNVKILTNHYLKSEGDVLEYILSF